MRSHIKFGRSEHSPFLHWSNENQCEHCGRGAILRHGRAWFHWGYGGNQMANAIGWEWVLGKCQLGVSLTVGGYGSDHELGGHLMVPGLSFYWHIDRIWPQRWRERVAAWWKARLGYEARETSIRVDNGTLWWKVWAPENSWTSDTPKWQDGNWDFAEQFKTLILGKQQYSSVEGDPVAVLIPLPEAEYPATAKRVTQTWKRLRGRALVKSCWDFDIPKGLPIPGKGENSWDCGEDGIYGLASSEENLRNAIQAVVKRVLDRREKYASRDWRPKAVA